MMKTLSMASVQPFQLEPVRSGLVDNWADNTEDDEHEDYQRGEDARVGQDPRCLCSNCLPKLTERESVCGKELRFLTGAVKGEQMDQISMIV